MGFLERMLERRKIKRAESLRRRKFKEAEAAAALRDRKAAMFRAKVERDRYLFQSPDGLGRKAFDAMSPTEKEFLLALARGQSEEWVGRMTPPFSEAFKKGFKDAVPVAWWETDRLRTVEKLDPLNRQLLDFLSEGTSDEEIAAKLEVDVPTVKEKIRNLLGLLDVPSRLAAVAIEYPENFQGSGSWYAIEHLAPRQEAILRLLVNGAEDQEIAHALGISLERAQQDVEGLLNTLQVDSRRAAVALALQNRFQYWYSPEH